MELIKQLAEKKYLSLQLEDIQEEMKTLETYLEHHQLYVLKAPKLINDHPQLNSLLESSISTKSKEFENWISKPYERNNKNPEQLIHKSISGNVVRSKSEALIDMALYQHQIPFRYESSLILNENTLYPDFTIMHSTTGKIMYWEHFGMMDSPVYYKNVSNKLQFYFSNKIIPNIQLITTYETVDHPLTTEDVEKVIEYYFM